MYCISNSKNWTRIRPANINNLNQIKKIAMKTDIQSQNHNPNALITDKFQKHKGFFIIDARCIMTEGQIVNVRSIYMLVEFLDGGDIQYRDVEFWHAVMKGDWLKIIVYDIENEAIVTRIHDMTKDSYSCKWFLISEDVFENEIAI
jgi:hypothetical protein